MSKAPGQRRTQAERRLQTRQATLNSAIEVLREQGYAGLSTTAVAKAAGLSQGAMYRYFPSKTHLVVAAIEELFASMTHDFTNAVPRHDDPTMRVASALQLLDAIFTDDRLTAAYDLYTAARTDPELASKLQPIIAAHTASIENVARTMFANDSALSEEQFRSFVELAIFALQGMAFGRTIDPDDNARRRLLAQLARLANDRLIGDRVVTEAKLLPG